MRSTWIVAGALAAGIWAFCKEPARCNELLGAKLGQKISDVGFIDSAGKTVALADRAGKRATVVVFLSFDCPISTAYSPVLADLAKRSRDRGVNFLGVCPSEDQTARAVAKSAEDFGLGFPVYCDLQGAAVSAFKAERTPEAFVLDHNLVLRYRGRIDDSYSARLRRNLRIKNHDLESALDEVVAGKPVSQPISEAVGCPIGIERKVSRDGAVTYYRDVAPIIQARCQECHRAGQVGPFSLTNFRQAVNWADDIKEYTGSHTMPPWKITEGVEFQNDRRMTRREIATLSKWVDEGTPEGNPHDAPAPPKFVDGWQMGKPDLILSTDKDFVLGPGGRDLFRCFVLPTHLTEDKFVIGYEVKPGNPRVVHHTLNFIDATGRGLEREMAAQRRESAKKDSDYDRGPGYSSSMGIGFSPQGGLGGWAPGQRPHRTPEGYGFRLLKGTDVVVQVHYHRDGRLERDRLQIGLYFAKNTKGMKAIKGGIIAGAFVAIPPNDSHFRVTGFTQVEHDCVLHSVMPHMHLLGRTIKVTMQPPGGKKTTLLDIENWDYNWQETYFLKEPIPLKVGTLLNVEAVYDNTDGNPNNPNSPPKLVTLGEQTTNEMCFVFLGATTDFPGRSPFSRPYSGRRRPFDHLRRPGDGKTAEPAKSAPEAKHAQQGSAMTKSVASQN